MNRTIVIFFVLLCSSCINLKKPNLEKNATRIAIKFVDMDIETPIDVKCADFEKYFQDIQIKVIIDSMKIDQILNTLKHLNIADSTTYYQHVDTRIKLEICYENDSIETLCIDRFVVKRNDKLNINSDTLKSLLLGK